MLPINVSTDNWQLTTGNWQLLSAILLNPVRQTKVIISFALVFPLALSSCTPDAYRRSADGEVYRILRERKSAALGYEPAAEASGAPAPKAMKPDYQKIPVTAVQPEAPPPLATPGIGAAPYGKLGPARDVVPLRQGYRVGSLQGGADDNENLAGAADRRVAGPPAPGHAQRLDLFGSLKYAVQHSRAYQDRMEDLYLAALDVTLERHLFAPRPFARATAEFTGGQADVDYRSALAATAAAGVRQKLPYGGEVVAETLVRFVDAIEGEVENGESAEVALSGTVPLLRGAGMVNLEPLISSEREMVYEVRAFEAFRRSFAVNVSSQYFGLLAQQQSISNRLQNYATLASLLERAQALYEAKRFSYLEVQRAEQSLLDGENKLIDARLSYANALDDFKIALGMDVNDALDVVPVQMEVPVPEIRGTAAVETAYRYRLELQTAKDRIADAVRGVEVARNGLLPEVNLTARAGTGNRNDTAARQLDSRTLEYAAGLNVDFPVDRVAERNQYRRALITFDRAQREFEDQRDQVSAEVRQDSRGIRSAQSSLLIQRQSMELAERRLELANERLRLGVPGADTREVVEAQEDLLTAQDSYQRAQATLQIRVLEFLRDTGTLRVDPDAGELGQAMDRKNRQAGAGNRVDINGTVLPQY